MAVREILRTKKLRNFRGREVTSERLVLEDIMEFIEYLHNAINHRHLAAPVML
jgi:hypothetical protein